MKIWIDADACPNVIKEIIFKAASRTETSVVVVANKPIRIPISRLITMIQVPHGFDMADERILEDLKAFDLVITADIPFADAAITKGAFAINPRGDLYTAENIKDRLATRDLMANLRDSGVIMGGGPKALGLKDRQSFANKLDALLAQCRKNS